MIHPTALAVTTPRHIPLIIAAALIAAAIAVWLYSAFDPVSSVWFPRCMIKTLTGYDCPGCGSQRAIHALLTGHPADAWHHNAAFVLSLPLLALIAVVRLWPRLWPRLTRLTGSRPFILSIFFLFILWTIGRNLPID